MCDLFWLLRQGFVLLCPGRGYEHGPFAYVGALLLLGGLALAGWSLWRAARRLVGRGARPTWPRIGAALSAGALLVVAGAGGVCLGTRFAPDAPATRTITGATVTDLAGPDNAPYALLVTVAGYGSQSPGFSEPASLREQAPDRDSGVGALFRRRLLVRLTGGFAWPDEARGTLAVAEALDTLLREPSLLALWQGGPAVVVAHSRGTHVTAATPAFAAPGWTRIALHPPGGVHGGLLLFRGHSPEIGEIHRVGGFMAGGAAPAEQAWGERAPAFAGFPWTLVIQARGWDHTVRRLPPRPGLPLLNVDPWGSHSAPFSDGGSAAWERIRGRLTDASL